MKFAHQLDLVNGYTDDDLIEMIKILSGEPNPEENINIDDSL